MAVLIIGLVIMGVFLYIFGSKIIGYFLSQDYDEAACAMASKQSGELKFESPLNFAPEAGAAVGAIGGVVGCAIGATGSALATAGLSTVVTAVGCKGFIAGSIAVGAGAGYWVSSWVKDVNVFLDSGIVQKCGLVMAPISGTKTDLTLRLANASLWGCEYSKLSDKSRVTLVRSISVNITSGGNIAYNDVKEQMDAIYASYDILAEKRCALIWRINDTPIDCGQFRLQADAPTETEIDEMATGVIKQGDILDIRLVYCKDRFLKTDKSFVSIIGNVTT